MYEELTTLGDALRLEGSSSEKKTMSQSETTKKTGQRGFWKTLFLSAGFRKAERKTLFLFPLIINLI